MSLPPPPPRRRGAPETGSAPPPPDVDTRAARQAQPGRSPRWRVALLTIGALAGVAIIVGVVLVVTGGEDSGPAFKASTSVKLTAGETTIQRVVPKEGSTTLPTELQNQVLGVVSRYVDATIVTPLRKGKANDAALAEIFDTAAAARLAGPDRFVLIDEGFPKAVGKINVTSPPVAMTALETGDDKPVFVTASLDLNIKARAKQGTAQIVRTGSLVLAPDQATGWKITAWTLHVEHAGLGPTPAAPAPTPSTTAAKR